jgi:hypothetical protein
VVVDVSRKLNATLTCDLSGVNVTTFDIWGSIAFSELDYTNNGFSAEIAAAPKGERKGDNPLLSIMTPMKIESLSMPLITMYPEDFTLHNLTAFVGGGSLVNAQLQITGNVAQIADFVNVSQFAYHVMIDTGFGVLPDPSPAYFIPNMTSIIGDTFNVGDVSAPTMFTAELQIFIADDTPVGTYSGQIELINGTAIIASTSLNFVVQKPKYKILWEDYYNDYANFWGDCERLWGGALWGTGVSEWWKLAAEAGFDIDSLHQQLYLKQHIGLFGMNAIDPLEIVAYGGYDAFYMHDVDFSFRLSELLALRQLYETGKMDIAVTFDTGSESSALLTNYFGISLAGQLIIDLVVTGVDKTHPIFADADNFTMIMGPVLLASQPLSENSVTTGIATATADTGLSGGSGFVVAVNEMHADSHYTSRMVAASGGSTLEFLEYSDFIVWYYNTFFTGEGASALEVDTDKFAVNMLKWLDPQFANESPIIDNLSITPTTTKLGETVNVDAVLHDPEDDNFTVTVAVQKPDNSWNNATVVSVGGHWLRSFSTDLEGAYAIYVVATDAYGATTRLLGGTVNAVNMAPEIVSATISPSKVVVGESIFITVNGKDQEDIIPAKITVSIISPVGLRQDYNYSNVAFANVVVNTGGMAEGIYNVEVTVGDSNGKNTTAIVGSFEINVVGMQFPTSEATFGIGIIGLVVLILILFLIYRRFPAPSTVSTPAPPPTPQSPE